MDMVNQTYIVNSKKYQVVAYSVMGGGKLENQDSFNVYADGSQLIVVVADGLGSATFSKEGSSKIVDITTKILSADTNDESIALTILKEWKSAVGGNLNLYDTTVKFVKIKDEEITYGGIGDGWIAINLNGEFISLCADNIFSNQTDSILSFNLKDKFLIKRNKKPIKNLLISTDGFSEDMDKENGNKFLDDVYLQIREQPNIFFEELKKTLEHWPVESNRDDKTVVFIQERRK